MQGAPRGAPHVCGTLPTSCNVNNEPFIHPAAVTWPSTARGWQVHRTGASLPSGSIAITECSGGGAGSTEEGLLEGGVDRKLDGAQCRSLLPGCQRGFRQGNSMVRA